jgi:Transposase DDE domain
MESLVQGKLARRVRRGGCGNVRSERNATRRVLTQSDPESRIMKNPTDAAFEQDYNAQVAVDQKSLLMVGWARSNHPNDNREADPRLSAIPSKIGTPEAAALDAGYFGPATLAACAKRGIEPSIATGRDPHHPSWQQRFAPLPDPPPEDASAQVKMAYKLRTALGKAIYGARKCTVEPVIGIVKEVLGFRQCSLRGIAAAAGEWCLVCLAFNLKRFHTLCAG